MWTKAITRQGYNLSDVVEIEITPQMMREAEEEKAYYMANKQSSLTVPLAEDRDIKGSLCHQAVEIYLSTFSAYGYQSTRLNRHKGGDICDIIYNQRYIDVKHASGKFNPAYYFNHGCLVTQKEWHNKIADGQIDTLLFVNVNFDTNTCYILGFIDKEVFDAIKKPVTLKVDNYEVKSRSLTPVNRLL